MKRPNMRNLLLLLAVMMTGCENDMCNKGFIITSINRVSNSTCEYRYNDVTGFRRSNYFYDDYGKFQVGDTVYFSLTPTKRK